MAISLRPPREPRPGPGRPRRVPAPMSRDQGGGSRTPRHSTSLALTRSSARAFKALGKRYGVSRAALLTTWSLDEAREVSVRSNLAPSSGRPTPRSGTGTGDSDSGAGAGSRPPKAHYSITLPETTVRRIEALAQDLECSRSQLVERWIRYEAKVAGIRY